MRGCAAAAQVAITDCDAGTRRLGICGSSCIKRTRFARPFKNIPASFLRKADRDRRNRQYGIAGADVDRRDLQTFDWGSAISW